MYVVCMHRHFFFGWLVGWLGTAGQVERERVGGTNSHVKKTAFLEVVQTKVRVVRVPKRCHVPTISLSLSLFFHDYLFGSML